MGSSDKVRGPDWLSGWGANAINASEALNRFDLLPAIEGRELVGRWRGRSLPTGHPLDGLLELLGWYGKAFERSGQAHPLLFHDRSGAPVPLDPGLMPATVALRWPGLARSVLGRAAFAAVSPVLRTRRPAAWVCMRDFRGRRSAAMVYDAQPITDHFRAVDASRVIGLMARPGMRQPFFFLLERDGQKLPGGLPAPTLHDASIIKRLILFRNSSVST